jgi:sulfopyruvate decarboxylase subunit alpha
VSPDPVPATRAGARAIAAALVESRVTVVPSVPDTWIGWLARELRGAPGLRVIDVAREEEAVAIACGVALGGARAAVAIQNAGLLNCGGVIASLVQLYRLPCFFLVSLRGDARDAIYYHAPKGARTEPTLDAWGIAHARAAGAGRVGAQVRQALAWVEEARAPFALLLSAEDLA